MQRMNGVEPDEAGWFTRLIYWLARRKLGKLTGERRLIAPLKIAAHHTRLLWAQGQMELGQDAATSVPAVLKTLACIKAAAQIGCPF